MRNDFSLARKRIGIYINMPECAALIACAEELEGE